MCRDDLLAVDEVGMSRAIEPNSPSGNGLLSALPSEEYQIFVPSLQSVSLSLGEVIYDSGGHLDYIYFPTTSVVSLLYTMKDGSTAEMGLVGNDGVVGVALFLGGDTTPNRAVAQIAGYAYRLKAAILLREFSRGGVFQHLLLRYTQALITQISQTAVCNRLHSVENRLSRWLLLSHDRVRSNELMMTQEFLAHMLGGRRESVTVAAGRLQDAGLIHYARGHITIVDRKGMEAAVCECYHIVKEETDRLLADVSGLDQNSSGDSGN
jgi:CRP-like cAMP-binding protein